MPTGYTAQLDDNNKTTKEWFTQDLIREFGICVTLREEKMGLDEKQIRAKLEKDMKHDLAYHQNGLAGAKELQAKTMKRKQTEWEAEAEAERKTRKEHNDKAIQEAQIKKRRHEQVTKDLKTILENPDVSEITRNIARFGLQQLDTVKSECEPYLDDVVFTWKQYRAEREKSVKWDIEYHTKELKETKARWDERLEALNEVLTDIKRLFG